MKDEFIVFYLQFINSLESLGMFFSSAPLIRRLRKYTATVAIDLPLELERTRHKIIQAHKCLNNYLQTGIVPHDKIKQAQNKIHKILYIEDN